MQLINNFDEYLKKIYSELDNINPLYYKTFLIDLFEDLNNKWKDYEINQNDYSKEVIDCLEGIWETVKYIIQELENECEDKTIILDLKTTKLIKDLLFDLCNDLNFDPEESNNLNNQPLILT